MIFHILNGDCLFNNFKETQLNGQTIICRETLIEGTYLGANLKEFWITRANYIHHNYGENIDNYNKNVKSEFEKIINSPPKSELNLWFGYDLFCQVNLWFILSLISDRTKDDETYLIYPFHLDGDKVWDEYSTAKKDELISCFKQRIKLSKENIELGKKLWYAYKDNSLTELQKLSQNESECFPNLKEVIKAQIDRTQFNDVMSRPEFVIKDIMKTKPDDFLTVFREFIKRDPIYGFTDLQLRKMYDNVKNQQ